MNKIKFFVIVLLLAALLAGGLMTARAAPNVPPNPSSFYGDIHFISGDGEPTPDVDYIEAYVPGRTPYAARIKITTSGSNVVYAINVPGDDNDTPGEKEGGLENDVVTFKINGRIVANGVWHGGTNVRLNIHPPSVNPAATITSGTYVGVVNEAVQFMSDTTDWLSGEMAYYAWDLDEDGFYDDSTAQNPAYTFTTTGTKTVGLKVTDSQDGEDTESALVVVVALGGLTGQTYDGTSKSVSVTGLESPYTAEVKYAGSLSAPTNAGSYAVVITIKNGTTDVGTISKTMVIDQKSITVTAATDSKGYDGSTSSTGVPTITSGGPLAPGDSATWTQTFDTKHAGTGKTLTPVGTVSDGNGGNNYSVTFTPVSTGIITAKAITVTAVADTKEYDGTTTSAGVPTITSGGPLASGDSATWTQTFDSKHYGNGKTLTPTGTVSDDNNGNNYTVTFTPVSTGIITRRPITVTAVTDTKVYDGTTVSNGTPTITEGSLAPGDTATWTQSFDNKNVGTDKSLTPAGTLNDGNGGNNYVVSSYADTTGAITAKEITVTAVTDSKVYDKTTDSTGTPTITSGGPLASGDSAIWTQIFDNWNAGTDKTLTPTGTVDDGNGGNNYLVTFAPVSSGVITPRPITVKADDKSKVVGAGDPPLTYQITAGELVTGDNITGDLDRVDGEAVGTYDIEQGTLSTGINYSLTYVKGTFTITALQHTIPLVQGWNLVSIDLVPTDPTIAVVLASVAGNFDLVYAWDATVSSNNWLKYDNIPGSPDSLTTLTEKMGFWIHMTTADDLVVSGNPLPPPTTGTSINLWTTGGGWNLVGYPDDGSLQLPGALHDHGVSFDDYTLLYAFHAADAVDPWKLYDKNAPVYANDLTHMAPTYGYWIFVTADVVWKVGN